MKKVFLLLMALSTVSSSSLSNSGMVVMGLLEHHNQTRLTETQCGAVMHPSAGQLVWSEQLAAAAKQQATAMAQRNTLSHNVNGDIEERLRREGYRWSSLAENIASGLNDAESVFAAWLNSRQHCQNIVNPNFTEMGAAQEQDYWVVLFARPQHD